MFCARLLKNSLIFAPVFAEISEKESPSCCIFLLASPRGTFLKISQQIPFGLKIHFIAQYEYGCLLSSDLFDIFHPLVNISIGMFVYMMMVVTCNVVDDDCCVRVLDITRYERMEALLASRIPQLHSQCFILSDIDCLRNKINTDCRLSKTRVLPARFQ